MAQQPMPGIQVTGRIVVAAAPSDPVKQVAVEAPAWGESAAAAIEQKSSFDHAATVNGALPNFVRSNPRPVAPFPIVLNHTVRRYVEDMLAHPGGLDEAFARSRPYFTQMVRVLEQNGLPPDLVYLSFAESCFTSDGAGPWQLSKATARRFGLVVNNTVDERRDPIKSTRAAAEYLATLHDETDDWHIALIGWNKGETVLDRFLGLRGIDYNRLLAQLPRTTSALMNRFMAVAVIAHHARDYGLQAITFTMPPSYRMVRVAPGTSLRTIATQQGTSVDRLRELNPALLRDRVPQRTAGFDVRVPVATKAAL
ncbi:MAG: transglycosylase SLT domain-containing protein [Candidatus Binataceae bacterium]|nr:transglycosylase SLT domain-containing protein [Candidatus Binataceae bacterium]